MTYRQVWGPVNFFMAQKNLCMSKNHKRVSSDLCPKCWKSLENRLGKSALRQLRE